MLDVHLLNMFDDKVNNAGQEHQHGYFVNLVHGAQVKIRSAVRVVFTEEVSSYF